MIDRALCNIIIFFIFVVNINCALAENGGKLSGNYIDYGLDINRDGYFDYLIIEAGVDVLVAGEYTLMGDIYNINNELIDWSVDHGNFSNGYHTMFLIYGGQNINKSRLQGPFRLRDVILYSGSSDIGLKICDVIYEPHITSEYDYRDFCGKI